MTRFIYVKSGEIQVTSGSDVFTVKADTAVLLPSDRFYYISQSDAVYFEAEFETECKPSVLTPTPFECTLINELTDINTDDKRYSGLLNALALYLECDNKNSPQYQDNLFTKAAKIMESNITEVVSSDDLALQLGTSVSTLKRAFTKYAGIGVHDYFCFLKITLAKQLLKSGESVTDTARECGFSNQNYFSAAFKKLTGVSPKDFAGVKRRPVKNEAPVKKDMPSYLL